MRKKIKYDNQDGISKILFLFLILNLIPIITTSTIIPGLRGSTVYDLLVGSVFVMQTTVILLYFIGFTQRKLNVVFILITVLFLLFESITLTINLFSSVSVASYDYINALTIFVNFIILLCVPSKMGISYKGLEKFLLGVIALGITACLYNIIINFNGLLNLTNITNPYSINYSSFYLNRNSFAQFLFFAVIANTVLFIKRKTRYYYFNYLLFGINLFATLSRTAIATTLFFLCVFFAIYYRRKILAQFKMIVFICVSLSFALLNSSIREFVSNILIRSEMGTTHRSDLWRVGTEILNNSSWVFGIGQYTGLVLLKDYGEINSQFHSFYVEILIMGGIALVLVYLLLFSIIGKKIKVIYMRDEIVGTVYIAATISLLLYGLFESVSFFTMGYVGTLFTMFYITIPILYSNHILNTKGIVVLAKN